MKKARGNILIVDDTLHNLRLLHAMLTEQGYKVRGVSNGMMAVDSVRASLPDLILLDIKMPDISGYEVCQTLKSDERTSKIPIIFISTAHELFDKVKAFDVGGVDYIAKPFQVREVLARVETHLTLHNLQRELQQANEELELRVEERTLELARANERLREQIVERERLEGALLEISEREQRRLGQDLHDDVGQTLSGLRFLSQALLEQLEIKQMEEVEQARKITKLLYLVAQQIRGLVKGLHAINLGPYDLIPALQELASGMEQVYSQHDLVCVFTANEILPLADPQTATHLYRITQESITNAIKHGTASHIHIDLKGIEGQLVLKIRDNGSGITTSSERGNGYGLAIMEQRARLIHGTLKIENVPDGGTLVTCTLPLLSGKNDDQKEEDHVIGPDMH